LQRLKPVADNLRNAKRKAGYLQVPASIQQIADRSIVAAIQRAEAEVHDRTPGAGTVGDGVLENIVPE
jgi:hypothetical protein